jgi:hypothetical protein
MILDAPQSFETISEYEIVAWLQPSCAVAMPVALGRVSAGHWSNRSAGPVIVGGRVSCTVIVCIAVEQG